MATNPALTRPASRGRDDPPVTGLVARATAGDQQAWDALVDRYAPLVWAICRRHQLGDADAADAAQSVWLHLVEQLGSLRDPAALPGWLATTTRRECGRIARAARRPLAAGYDLDAGTLPDEQAPTADQELLTAERHAALREALGDLPAHCQRLLALLTADPPLPYAEISARLGIPVGSIGPTRRRCLDKLRRHPAIAALINAGTDTADSDIPGHAPARLPDTDHDGDRPQRPGPAQRPGRPSSGLTGGVLANLAVASFAHWVHVIPNGLKKIQYQPHRRLPSRNKFDPGTRRNSNGHRKLTVLEFRVRRPSPQVHDNRDLGSLGHLGEGGVVSVGDPRQRLMALAAAGCPGRCGRHPVSGVAVPARDNPVCHGSIIPSLRSAAAYPSPALRYHSP
jgi:RNA polymerase sigma factor (sigma-70 family)